MLFLCIFPAPVTARGPKTHCMKIVLLQVGKTNDAAVAAIAEIYSGRIKKYSTFEIVTIPELRNVRNVPVAGQKEAEGEKILRQVSGDDYLVLLDEHGRELNTAGFSAWLGKSFMLSRKRIVFAIGGPWGFSEQVHERADFELSLSKMTFPHQLVRLLFLEQLYRAFTVLKGDPYHHE